MIIRTVGICSVSMPRAAVPPGTVLIVWKKAEGLFLWTVHLLCLHCVLYGKTNIIQTKHTLSIKGQHQKAVAKVAFCCGPHKRGKDMLMFLCCWTIVTGRGIKKQYDTKTRNWCLPALSDVCLGIPKEPRKKRLWW